MKKTLIALTALTLALAMTGCSNNGQDTDSAAETTTVSATEADVTTTAEETQTEAVTEDTTAETAAATEAETAADSAETTAETTAETDAQAAPETDEAQFAGVTMNLLEEYIKIVNLSGMGLDVDSNDAYQPEGQAVPYYRVTDEKYQSIADVKRVVEQSMTGALKDEYDKIMFTSEQPIYIERDGKLYMLGGGSGNIFNFQKDTVKISDVTDKGFKATVKNKTYGEELVDVDVTVEKIDGKYYLSSYRTA